MNGFARKFLLVLLPALALAMAGCDHYYPGDRASEEKEPYFLEGKDRYLARNYKGAIESFEQALQSNPRSGAAHYQLGLIYDQESPDPASAIYHYEKYLKLRPNAENADLVQQRISGCKSKLAEDVPLGPVTADMQVRAKKMRDDIEKLTAQNQAFQRELEAARAANVAATQRPPQAAARAESEPSSGSPSAAQRAAASPPASPAVAQRRPATVQRTPAPQTRPKVSSTYYPTPPSGGYRSHPAPARRTHEVKRGETMTAIARRYGLRMSSLTAANPTVNPNRLQAGQVLNIP